MGGVSSDGKVLWLSGRYNSEVYAISTRTGRLLARIHVGAGPHGLCVGRNRAATRSATPTTCAGGLCPLAAAATLTLLLCGCGGHRQAQSTLQQRGRTVFAAACSGCHTLTGRDSRAPGGDLAIAKLTVADIASFAHVMPVHLSPADVAAVAAYVHAAAARSSR